MFTQKHNFYLARALYIPAIVLIIFGIYCLFTNQIIYVGMSGIFGTMLGLLSFLSALKSAGLITPTNTVKTGE